MARSPRLTGRRLRPGGPGVLLASTLTAAALTFTGGAAVASAATTSAPAAPAAHASAHQLCRLPARTTRVVINYRAPDVRPRSVKVTRVPQVRSLARAVCALPRLPAGTQCPAIATGFHRLTFTAGHRKLSVVTIQNAGCKLVTGLKTVRQADRPHFWKLMRKIMNQNRS